MRINLIKSENRVKQKNYTESKVQEALALAGNDEGRAARMILGWVADDPQLLLGLTRPHLNGIVAYAVDRAVRHVEREAEPPPAVPDFDSLPGEEFGKELLKTIAFGQPVRFGRESLGASPPAPKRPGASRRHIDAIHRIADASAQIKSPDKKS